MFVGRQNSGTSLPSTGNEVEGELFWKSDDNQLHVYNGSAWTLVTDARGNYFGSGADGSYSTSGNVEWAVPNNRAYSNDNGADGDMIVKNFTTLTIGSGHKIRMAAASRGMLIFCTGNCTINGTLSMSATTDMTPGSGTGGSNGTGESRGGAWANPANLSASGSHPDDWPAWGDAGSDDNLVESTGISFAMYASGASQNGISSNADGFYGCGTAARTAVNNFPQGASGMKVFRIARAGGAGGSGASIGTPAAGRAGGNHTLVSSSDIYTVGCGGGGSGGTSTGAQSSGGNGGAGTCWSGGAGGSGIHGTAVDANAHGNAYGGRGGGYYADNSSYGGDGGGAGNPGGHSSTWSYGADDGTGGLIVLIVGGTFSGTGNINAVGGRSGNWKANSNSGGGGSGGGAVIVACVSSSGWSGTINTAGGAANGCAGGSGATRCGGAGGNGSSTIQTVTAAA